MRFRLRYLQHDLELTEGEFVVGRNASCQLSLDDPLVSRRHAVLTVLNGLVTVEDLGSRNGVLVNGQRIEGRAPLQGGDRILIGAQEMTLVIAQEITNTAMRTGRANLTLPKVEAAPPHPTPPPAVVPQSPVGPTPPPVMMSSGVAAASAAPTGPPGAISSNPPTGGGASGGAAAAPITVSNNTDSGYELSMVRRADAFVLLGGVAEKALAMGRGREAERLLASPLADVFEASKAGKRIMPSLVDQAARFSAKLATATGKGAWFDRVIELYSVQQRPCPAPVTDELYNALRRVTSINLQQLRAYIEDLRGRLQTYGPAERFLFQRLEGLERLASLR